MLRLLILLAIAAIAVVTVGINRTPPPPVIFDVPGIIASGEVPVRSPNARKEGRLYWSTCASKHFSWLEVAALSPQGNPEIVTGEFVRPIKGRTEALCALGADKKYKVTEKNPESVVHTGGPFEQFTLFRVSPEADEYSGFYAATHLGLVNLE